MPSEKFGGVKVTVHFKMSFPTFQEGRLRVITQEKMFALLRPQVPFLISIFKQIGQYDTHDPVWVLFFSVKIIMGKEIHGVEVTRNCYNIIRFIDSEKRELIKSQNFYLCDFKQRK